MAAGDWPERTRMIVTISVVVVINLLLGGGLYYVYDQWRGKKAKHDKLVKERDVLKAIVDKKPEKERELASKSEEFGEQQRKLPDEEQIAVLTKNIEEIAQKSGCTLKTFRRMSSSPSQGYVRESWQTSWEADFMSFCKLMNEIEDRFDRFIAFESLTLAPKNSGVLPTGEKHDINVDMVTYYYKRQPGS
ncbi:MAG: type 4a pilus biogenesis protein PilO [Planctomycetota bacterium]|nr:type 4a pilus biogenesis protein PilO [Planctomycetota bacterium]